MKLALALLVLAAPVLAQIHVPGDYPDIQSAIDAAAPGAVIIVHEHNWYQPLRIDKPLTLMGDPATWPPILLPDGQPPLAESVITLDGPGHGVVRLSNLWIGGGVTAGMFDVCKPAIVGGGFDALHIFDSLVEGPPWEDVYNFNYPGADAIRVDLPLVWIERCVVRGADAGVFETAAQQLGADAGDAIVTTGALVLLDSTVSGGEGKQTWWDNNDVGGCPTVCPGGAGGDGVVCNQLLRAGSTITAGSGMLWKDEWTLQACCSGPAGIALQAGSVVELGSALAASGPARLGQPWSLSWTAPAPAAVLFVSAGVGTAPQLGAPKLHLLPPLFLGVVVSSPGGLATTVPADAALTGLEFGVQLYSTTGWTRPVASVILP